MNLTDGQIQRYQHNLSEFHFMHDEDKEVMISIPITKFKFLMSNGTFNDATDGFCDNLIYQLKHGYKNEPENKFILCEINSYKPTGHLMFRSPEGECTRIHKALCRNDFVGGRYKINSVYYIFPDKIGPLLLMDGCTTDKDHFQEDDTRNISISYPTDIVLMNK